MGIFVRAIITGFGFSLGAALFKKVAKDLGLAEPAATPTMPAPVASDGGPSDGNRDPGDGGAYAH
jgi:hypothetical protein